MKEVRTELSWHGGHTLVVFQTIGPDQISIDVLSSERTTKEPYDTETGRRILHSIGLVGGDVKALENFLAQRRAVYPTKA